MVRLAVGSLGCRSVALLLISALAAGCTALSLGSDSSSRADVSFSDAGEPEGPCAIFDASGRPEARGEFANGHRQGTWTFWDSAGTTLVELSYRDGIKNGPCRMWYGAYAFPDSAGSPKLSVDFADDRESGRRRSWWPNGALKCESDLANGVARTAHCWTETGRELSATESMQTTASDLEADATYLRILDEVVAESVARAAAAPTYLVAGGTDLLTVPRPPSRTLLIRNSPKGRACMKDCESGSNACGAACAGTDSTCLERCAEQRMGCMEKCPGARWTTP